MTQGMPGSSLQGGRDLRIEIPGGCLKGEIIYGLKEAQMAIETLAWLCTSGRSAGNEQEAAEHVG